MITERAKKELRRKLKAVANNASNPAAPTAALAVAIMDGAEIPPAVRQVIAGGDSEPNAIAAFDNVALSLKFLSRLAGISLSGVQTNIRRGRIEAVAIGRNPKTGRGVRGVKVPLAARYFGWSLAFVTEYIVSGAGHRPPGASGPLTYGDLQYADDLRQRIEAGEKVFLLDVGEELGEAQDPLHGHQGKHPLRG